MFLTVAVIVWGIVEVIQYNIKSKKQKSVENNLQTTKILEDKIDRLERRMGNLEAIIADEGYDSPGDPDRLETSGDQHSDAGRPGKLSNKLRT